MKKYIWIFLLLFPSLLWATGNTITIDGVATTATIDGTTFTAVDGVTGTSSGDSCTGGLLFSWHCESTSITTDGGCPAGMTATPVSTPTLSTAQYHDGSHSCYFAPYGRSYTFPITSDDIIYHLTGHIDFWIYFIAFDPYAPYVFSAYGTNDAIHIVIATTGQLSLVVSRGGSAKTSNGPSGAYLMTTGTWYHVIAHWDDTTSHGGDYNQKICYDTTNATTCAGGNDKTGTWANDLATLQVGSNNIGSAPADYYIDQVKIYNTW
jgi:hypothetical protein